MTDPTNENPPPSEDQQRDRDVVLTDAIRILTEAARLRRQVLEPADWAEFVTLAVAGAAANVGSIERALAGRPGSWEAESVRTMLTSTVGDDQAELRRHRTEPVRVELWPEEILMDIGYYPLYDESRRVLDEQREQLQWRYRLAHDKAARERGVWEALDNDAPPFEEPTGHERGETWDWSAQAGRELTVPRSETAETELERIGELEGALEELKLRRDPAAYGEALRTAAIAKAAELFPGQEIPVVIREGLRDDNSWDEWIGPDDQIEEAIRAETPLPWSAMAPKDYRGDGQGSIADVERAAGRLPRQRVDMDQYRAGYPDTD